MRPGVRLYGGGSIARLEAVALALAGRFPRHLPQWPLAFGIFIRTRSGGYNSCRAGQPDHRPTYSGAEKFQLVDQVAQLTV